MISEKRNNLFYICALIEYIGRKTKNHRRDIVKPMGKDSIQKLLKDAPMNHCLSFEQVSDEIIEQYKIENGSYDTITNCKYKIPGYQDIGRLYTYLIEELEKDMDETEAVLAIFESFISDEISDFRTGVYYENPSYLIESHREGSLL